MAQIAYASRCLFTAVGVISYAVACKHAATMTAAAADRAHHRRRFSGRDPDEAHRAATPLELLFDLTFVVAFGTAGNELAHYLADGDIRPGILGFVFATFAVSWAWINYSWFASAYDTDDWVFRVATMVQMVGVIVLALGLQRAFASIARGDVLDNGVMVAGYVVMRVWVVLAIIDLPIEVTFAIALVLIAIETSGPYIAERYRGGTPWHARHIAERYGLLVIITLGEGILGTVASINAVVHGSSGWTVTPRWSRSRVSASRSGRGGRTSRSRGGTCSSFTASGRFSGATGT